MKDPHEVLKKILKEVLGSSKVSEPIKGEK